MKDYRTLIKELPSNTLVCAVGEFNPPTTAHELLIKTVKVVAEQKGSDHVIFTAPSDLIQEEKKEQFLKIMFPTTKFQSLGESFFSSTIKELNQKYKNIVIIAGADQFDEFKKLKESSNIQIISIGDKDPDVDFPKMKQYATKGLYEEFKKKLPSNIRDIDGKRLMNEMRSGMGLDPIKEQINLVKDKLREQYFKGAIFNEGDIVESDHRLMTIVKRGSNHLLLKEETGELVSKWIHDVKLVEAVVQPNGTDKVEASAPESDTGAKKDAMPKGKTKGFITFYNYNKEQQNESAKLPVSKSDDDKDSESDLDADNEKKDYDPREVGNALVANNGDKGSAHLRRQKDEKGFKEETAQELLKKISSKFPKKPNTDVSRSGNLNAVGAENMHSLGEASSAAVKLQKAFQRAQEKIASERKAGKKLLAPTQDRPGAGVENNPTVDPFFKEDAELDLTDDEINLMIESLSDQDIEDTYTEEEVTLVYEDTGDEVEHHPEEFKVDLMEVLSRQERMKQKMRLRKTATKRERSTKIALKRFSSPEVVNKRARRLAIKLMKKRMLRGRDPAKVSVGEKERIEKAIAKRKDVVSRVAQKLVVRVRRVEKSRMSHGKSTKGNMPSVF